MLAAALAGGVDFDGPKRYRANTGGEKMKMAKSALIPDSKESIEDDDVSPITFKDID